MRKKRVAASSETVALVMSMNFVTLSSDWKAHDALEFLRQEKPEQCPLHTLFITDQDGYFLGSLRLECLVLAERDALLMDLMNPDALTILADADQEDAALMMQNFDLLALPVVTDEHQLLGVLTVDAAMDILELETTEDFYQEAGLSRKSVNQEKSDLLISGTLRQIWKIRLPFLIFAVVAAMLSGGVIEGFEGSLQSIPALAIFVPLIMTMGGNIGTQSSTVFVRGLATKQIKPQYFWKYFFKEVLVGVSLGMIVGGISGVIAGIWQGAFLLGFVVGLALLLTMLLASMLGFLVPYLLMFLKADQAAGATPILTAVKDILGLIIYFLLVQAFLGHYL